MHRIEYFVKKHPDLFRYRKAEAVHPHDLFLDRTLLRFFSEEITPNRVSALRIALTPLVFGVILAGFYKVGIFLFLFTAFTDAIDGSLARTRNQITKFGMLFDPLADKLLIGSMVLLLVFRYYPVWLGLTVLVIELLFIILATLSVLKYKFKTVHMANVWGKIKMILQVLAVFATLLALLLDTPQFLTLGAGLFGLAIGFAVVSLFAQGI